MNISEIAQLAGVSKAAVSRYFNNGYISEEKRERIEKVVKETGYVPSTNAQMLRTNKTKMIGVILPKINSQSISEMVAGISGVLDANGYQLLLANTKNSVEEEIKYINVFRENHVDGIILIATILTEKHRKALKGCSMPIVILGQKSSRYSCVFQDDFRAAKEVTEELLKNCTKPGFLGVLETDVAVGYNRRQGFRAAIEETGIPIDENREIEADFSIDAGYEAMKDLHARAPEIDGIFCVTESIAIGALTYLKEQKIRVPKDVKIAAMGDSSFSRVLDPKLTTVHLHYQASGKEAAKILLEEITQEDTIRKELCMSFEIRENESTR